MGECDFKVTIVGLGLIGASYGLALKKLSYKNVSGLDISSEILIKAEERGIITKGYLSAKEALKDSDLVIIALYPNETINFIKNNLNNFKSGVIITDTAGLKEEIVTKINSILPKDLEFIGGHPMAGREGKGIDMASGEIFKGASYILTPVKENSEENVELLSNLAYSMGCIKVIKIDPATHDNMIGYTSQLPHILAITLINSNECDSIDSFVGGGFKDLTRIAINNSSLWSELLIHNKHNLINSIDNFQKEVENIKRALINGDENFIKERFEEANIKRKGIQ
ncbi:MAG: prephenate dehydrogenase [Clostridiaceae bacterium]|nr:prephenate dehydrogenase [Clostridiaceae bacterium]